MQDYQNTITLIVTGSIAAQKVPELVNLLLKKFKVNLVLTNSSYKFVNLNLIKQSNNLKFYSYKNLKEENRKSIHVDIATNTNLLVVYPASQNFIAKVTHGFTDDLTSLIFSSVNSLKMVFPSMNSKMYLNQINLNNIRILRSFGIEVLEPKKGKLACGEIGIGRAWSPDDVFNYISTYFQLFNKLLDKRVLLTFGRTRSYLDSIRYITNNSTGKMGLALHQALVWSGARVTNIIGDIDTEFNYPHIKALDNQTMFNQIKSLLPEHDIFISNASLNDFKVEKPFSNKITKTKIPNLNLNLIPNIDVLGTLTKKDKGNKLFIGFSAQDNDDLNQSIAKLKSKNLDAIILNHINVMGQDETQVTWITPNKNLILDPMPKLLAAQAIINQIMALL